MTTTSDVSVPIQTRFVPRSRPKMAPDVLAAYLRERLGDRVVETDVAYGQLWVTVEADVLPDAARLCKEDPELAFEFFDFLSAVDLREEGFAVVVHLYSVTRGHHINLRTVAAGGRETPKVPTLTGVYRGANWHERETYDMFGIEFEGHPGLLPRILTVENFEGWPLRKEFLLSTREAKPWPGLKEPEEVAADAEAEEAGASAAAGEPTAEDKAAAAKEKVERAKAKAAEMRAKRARERADAQRQPAGGDRDQAAERRGADTGAADGEPADQQAAAAERTRGGETAGEAAAVVDAAAGDPTPRTPEGAAEIAGTDIAKDAAAGAVGGDTAAGAPSDRPGAEQPVTDIEAEREVAEGAPAGPSAVLGTEVEGRRGGAEVQSGAKPAAETPGMDAEPEGHAARRHHETPAPGPEHEPAPVAEEPADVPVEPPPGPRVEEPPTQTGARRDAPQEEFEAEGTAGSAERDEPPPSQGTDAADRTPRPGETGGPEPPDTPGKTGGPEPPDTPGRGREAGR
jgi:NADH:ubiquinone oxidoreductase subunit C